MVPFINESLPDYHMVHMDNAPAHTALTTQEFWDCNWLNYRPASAQSLDLNPIELAWNDLKYWLGKTWRPLTKAGLIIGIEVFLRDRVTVEYCNRKIDHLKKVIPKVIQFRGKATGL